jgi:transcriptional regulator with XRE-family HTH domain
MSLGVKLMKYRDKRGMSQREAAQLIGVAQSTYSDWESDLVTPKAENFLKISQVYDIDLKELISGVSDINIKNKNGNVITGSNVKIDSTEAILKLAEGLEKLTQLIEKLIQKP